MNDSILGRNHMTYDLDLFAEGDLLIRNSIPWDEHHNCNFFDPSKSRTSMQI